MSRGRNRRGDNPSLLARAETQTAAGADALFNRLDASTPKARSASKRPPSSHAGPSVSLPAPGIPTSPSLWRMPRRLSAPSRTSKLRADSCPARTPLQRFSAHFVPLWEAGPAGAVDPELQDRYLVGHYRRRDSFACHDARTWHGRLGLRYRQVLLAARRLAEAAADARSRCGLSWRETGQGRAYVSSKATRGAHGDIASWRAAIFGAAAAILGRTDERELFSAALDARELPFHVLYVFGPGGIGKTTLLGEFAALCEERQIPYTLLDARGIQPQPDALLAALPPGLTPAS